MIRVYSFGTVNVSFLKYAGVAAREQCGYRKIRIFYNYRPLLNCVLFAYNVIIESVRVRI